MNFVKPALSVLTILIFLMMAMASSGVKNMSFSKPEGQIPPNFGENNDTLLVLKSNIPGDINSRLRKSFRQLYKGNYKIISNKELTNYPPEKYRYTFALGHVASTIQVYNPSTGISKSGPGTLQCIVSDRIAEKKYYSGNTAFYGKLLKAFVPALSSEVKP